MSSKLSRFCEGIIEAAWIAALILAPVFFNIYSSRIFEPDKISIIRSIAVIILFAWLVRIFEERGKLNHPELNGKFWFKRLIHFPLIAAVIALVGVTVLATIFSVTPRVSVWGSYQRLQGLYTTISYLIIFVSIVGNLRRGEQVQRLITVGIISSLPISLYGIIQRYQLDPIPWGGDVSVRIASNMGNSIFVAAFLILVIPVTLIRIIESIESIWKAKNSSWIEFTSLTGYFFILALQMTALYFSGSRGPWLGWLASMFFLWLGFSFLWRQRWMSIAGVSVAGLLGLFLILLNIPGGPLENLRQMPEFGRLGQLLDAESRTGKVRSLIWQGAAELVFPHAPIEFPDGQKDQFNFIRPIIGYGPESMYVAYNPFYPPELTQVEKRNASPDRSHNETWDALVTTGFTGLIVYLTLFSSVLYFGLKWLGMIQNSRQRILFISFYLGWGFISSLAFFLWKGIPFLGVALPFGMIFGFLVYVGSQAIFGQISMTLPQEQRVRSYILLAVLATILAHFIEINFGIAIVSTRTYFWIFSAILLTTGKILPELGEFGFTEHSVNDFTPRSNLSDQYSQSEKFQVESIKSKDKKSTARVSRRRQQTPSRNKKNNLFDLPVWFRYSLVIGLIVALLLSTLGMLYITNASRSPSALSTIWNSMTVLIKDSQSRPSPGIVLLFLSTSVIGVGLLVTEFTLFYTRSNDRFRDSALKTLGLGIVIAIALSLLFGILHAERLVSLYNSSANTIDEVLDQVRKSESLLTFYYAYLFGLLLLLGFFLVPGWPDKPISGWVGLGFAITSVIFALLIIVHTNMRVIQADMSFKTADIFDQKTTWPVAIRIYERANDLAPNEDYYYLFLGRAYLEYARSLDDTGKRDQLFAQAASDLREAQTINPLNPDHTANLARLHSLWAISTDDPVKRQERAELSNDYFSRAVVLKPKDAKLWDEWALLSLNVLEQPEAALQRMEKALEIDPFYDWTYGLLGNYAQQVLAERAAPQSEDRYRALQQAADYYKSALQYTDGNNGSIKYNYALSLAAIYYQLNQIQAAVEIYKMALEILPGNSENWKINETLAQLYLDLEDEARALSYALAAFETAPEDQKSRLQEFISSIEGQS